MAARPGRGCAQHLSQLEEAQRQPAQPTAEGLQQQAHQGQAGGGLLRARAGVGALGGGAGGHSHVEPAQLHLLVSLEPEPLGSLKQDFMAPALCLERSFVLSGGPTWG